MLNVTSCVRLMEFAAAPSIQLAVFDPVLAVTKSGNVFSAETIVIV